MKVKVKGNRAIHLGTDSDGKKVNGKPGEVLNVPSQLSKESAIKALRGGFVEEVKAKKETATKSKRSKATK